MMTAMQELLTALGATDASDLYSRLEALGLLEPCYRCEGSGPSWCAACEGSGMQTPRIRTKLIAEVVRLTSEVRMEALRNEARKDTHEAPVAEVVVVKWNLNGSEESPAAEARAEELRADAAWERGQEIGRRLRNQGGSGIAQRIYEQGAATSGARA